MNTVSRPSTIRLSPALHRRVAAAAGDAMRALWIAWRSGVQRRREERAIEPVGAMNEALLRDIGAPDRLIAEAAARRCADRRRLPANVRPG